MNQLRRKFIKQLTLTGFFATGFFQIESFSTFSNWEQKLNAKKRMTILFQGDSITDGNRGRTDDPNHIMGHGYAFSIAGRLGADYTAKQYQFYNRGISGNKIIDLPGRWQTDTIELKPDVLSILIGINDASSVVLNWEPVVTTGEYEREYDALLRQTQDILPEIVLVLCEPFILKAGNVAENWEAYQTDVIKRQEVVRKLAMKYNAVFVGFQEVFDKASRKAPAGYWIWDGVHPTVTGHELMAREWIKQVRKKISFT